MRTHSYLYSSLALLFREVVKILWGAVCVMKLWLPRFQMSAHLETSTFNSGVSAPLYEMCVYGWDGFASTVYGFSFMIVVAVVS